MPHPCCLRADWVGTADTHDAILLAAPIRGRAPAPHSGVSVSGVSEQKWGKLAIFTLPGGRNVGIYQPKHPRPMDPK
ncbi:MAG: hypothetical protein WA830_24335 [Candidatus Sulfotelmatobacter sp.]